MIEIVYEDRSGLELAQRGSYLAAKVPLTETLSM